MRSNTTLKNSSKYFLPMTIFFVPISVALMNIFLFLAFMSVLISKKVFLEEIKNNFLHNKFIMISTFLFFSLALGVFWSLTDLQTSLGYLKKYSVLLIPILFSHILVDDEYGKKILHAFILSMSLILFLGLVFKLTDTDSFKLFLSNDIKLEYRTMEGFKSHIITNILMSFFYFYLLNRFFSSVRTYKKMLYFFLALTSLYYIFFINIGTSGQVIAIILTLFLLFHYKSFSNSLGILVILVLSYNLLSPSQDSKFSMYVISKFNNTIASIKSSSDERVNLGTRPQIYENSIILIMQNPILGSGTGSYNTIYKETLPKIFSKSPGTKRNPHSEFLHISIQLGILGLILFLWVFKEQIKLSLEVSNKEQRLLIQGFILFSFFACLGNSFIMDSGEGHFWAIMSTLFFSKKYHNSLVPKT